jgi:hypothetical protein
MENKDLTVDLVEKWGEEVQMEMIIEKCLELSLSIQHYKRTEIKEDYLEYSKMYNIVCEKIADMKLMIEQSEFLFNANEIKKHYENKLENLKKSLNDY